MSTFILKSIKLANFRNYEGLTASFFDGMNVFTGKNGSGKTSLLDAIHYMSIGKSAFAGSDREVMKEKTDFFRIQGQFEANEINDQVVVKYNKGKKQLELNGSSAKIQDYIGSYPTVCISPKDMLIIIHGSAPRRKLMDLTLSQQDKAYLLDLIHYKRLLKQRNELLKKFAKQGNYNIQLLDTFDEQMIPLCKSIHAKRQAFANDLSGLLKQYYQIISDHKEEVELRYTSQLNDREIEDVFIKNADRDRFTQKTNGGVHKDDLDLLINGQSLRTFGSQGQQKSFVMSLKLAQFEWLKNHSNKTPILILDDIFDKLDKSRVERLLKMLSEQWDAQIFISDTDTERIPSILGLNNIPFQNLIIQDGQILSE